MADMQIAMRLSLADLASAPLAQFMEKLQGLTALADKVSASFKKLGTGATSFGRSASAAGQGTVKLTETLSTLAQRLGGLEAKLGAVVESFTLLGRSAVTSAAGMRAGTEAMEGATLAAGRFHGKLSDVSSSLKGMAELWAAFKIEHGLTKSFEAASDMQSQMAQMRLAGFSQDQAEFARATANRLAQQNPQVSSLDAMEAYEAPAPAKAGVPRRGRCGARDAGRGMRGGRHGHCQACHAVTNDQGTSPEPAWNPTWNWPCRGWPGRMPCLRSASTVGRICSINASTRARS